MCHFPENAHIMIWRKGRQTHSCPCPLTGETEINYSLRLPVKFWNSWVITVVGKLKRKFVSPLLEPVTFPVGREQLGGAGQCMLPPGGQSSTDQTSR